MAAKYGISEKDLAYPEYFNAMKIISDEITLHQDQSCVESWKIAFTKEPAKVAH